MSDNGDEPMTSENADADTVPTTQTWETLPDTIPGVVAFFADRIATSLKRSVQPEDQPTDSAASLEFYVNNPNPLLLPSAEYLAQREAIRELGLDPDILAPIKPVDLLVGFYLGYLTFPEQATRDCILWNGWSQADCDTICAQLVFVQPEAVAYVATLTPGVQTINGNLVNIIL
jgi:hypothetical protein